jgi:pre-mRNA-processing factor 6
LAVENEPKRTRKAKIVDAMKKGENNPYVVLSIAKIFWKEKKYEKARKWMERSLALDANIGDTWAYYWKFILTQEG